ncbi:hypothetical protein [Streptomyces erythrochromogenes]|uniref:hypothetical protein n=1 Tax=Streptomyces erythrochromogenes TaxID=285574 RepID=UPI0033EE43CE
MQPVPGATVALAPAAPGWTVTTTSVSSGDPINAPIAAWASVVVDPARGLPEGTEIVAVFLVDGSMWTEIEFRDLFGYKITVNAPPLPAP